LVDWSQINWPSIGAGASTASAIFSAIALIIAFLALRKHTRATNFEMFESCFNRIVGLEKELYDKYVDEKKDKTQWDSMFFNSIEELAFLANEGYLDDPKIVNFFKPAIINWYEAIFQKFHTKEEIESPDSYPEMKKLYRKLKEGHSQEYSMVRNNWRKGINKRFVWNCLLIAFVIFLIAVVSDFSVKMFYSGGGWSVQILGGLIAIVMITSLLVFASIAVRGFRHVLLKMFEIEDDESTPQNQ